MGIFTGILELITSLLKALPFFDKWFTKTPEEKAKEEVIERRNDSIEKIGKVGDAIKEAKESGDTSKLERIINRGK